MNRGKGRRAASPDRIPFWPVRSLLGLILIAAGAIKLYETAFEAQDETTPTLLLMAFAEAELLGGLWMVGGHDCERTRQWAAAAFAALAASSLFQALAGKCSCGCFGSLTINPWFVLVFDLAAVAALVVSRPPADPEADRSFFAQPLRLVGLGILALVVGVAGWSQAGLVTVAGTATADGRPLEEATLRFTGNSGRITLRTDRDGNFRLAMVRPGLYAVSVPGRVAPVPVAKIERADRGPQKKKAMQRSRNQPVSSSQPSGGESLSWIEIPRCSEGNKIVNLE